MSERQLVIDALLRQDLPSFLAKAFSTLEPGRTLHQNWHHLAMTWALSQVAAGQMRRLIINVPPRHLKSLCVTVAFTAWVLGRDPSRRIMSVSYGEDLARKHAVDARMVMESDWYRRIFPSFGLKAVRQREVVTTSNGFRYAGSVGGAILGRGADLIVIDDPIKSMDVLSAVERQRVKEFYDNTLYTRLDDKGRGAIVIVMQRLHADDLVGHVLSKEDWEVLTIPALATEDHRYDIGPGEHHLRRAGELIQPEREGRDVLELIRRTLGSLSYSAQYQQAPVPPEGNAIKREWLRFYDAVPADLDLVVVSWDPASTLGETSDYSVGTVWGLKGSDIYLLDVVRGRFEVPDLRRRIIAVHQQRRAHATIIEETDIGRALVQEMRQQAPVRPILYPSRVDKEARLLAQAPKIEAGQVLLPREAPWLACYMTELLAFPNGSHDDQVDSTSQALGWLSRRMERPELIDPPDEQRRRPPGQPRPR
ncbi:MAG: phage terminase large subunit [Alphaproteobacteria bacterium]|nr:phage terminase large subunit [Alphaproteobacteria bacterium]